MSGKPKLSDLRSKSAVPEPPEAAAPAAPSRMRWWMGWVVGPGLVAGSIVGVGAWVGAHFPEAWFVRLVVWLGGG
jgi:hypothetical protein